MTYIMDTVELLLKNEDVDFDKQVEDECQLITCTIERTNCTYKVMFFASDENEYLKLRVLCPNDIPEAHRACACEFLTRVNCGLPIGHFDMDMEDGQLRYSASVVVTGGQLTPLMVKSMLIFGLNTMDNYYPGIMSMIYAGTSPADAIKQVES